MAAILYLLTAGTAVWYYRRQITSSAANFFLGGVRARPTRASDGGRV
jgi:hypothetical protein